MYFVFICSRGQNNIWYYCLADEARLSSKIVTAIKKNNTEYTLTGIYNPLQRNFCALVYQYTGNLKQDEKRDYRDVLIILDKQMLYSQILTLRCTDLRLIRKCTKDTLFFLKLT